MSRREVKDETQIRDLVRTYVELYGANSTVLIADYVHGIMGVRPSTATIAKILREMGFTPPSQWVKA
jgi:hypothetical protein